MSHKIKNEALSHEEKPYPCDKCFEIFDTEKSLEKHKITEHSDSFLTIEIFSPITNEGENLPRPKLLVHGKTSEK